MKKIILDLCGGTGSWSKYYRENDDYQVKLITWPENDVIDFAKEISFKYNNMEKIHGILAAPPCTVFAVSGARWWRPWSDIQDALQVVNACMYIIYKSKPVWWCLENPVGSLSHYLGKPKHYFQPWQYGDMYTKKTCLWGNFNMPVPIYKQKPENVKPLIHYMSPGPNRAKNRSITPDGFAKCFYLHNP